MEKSGFTDKWKKLKKDQILIGILAGILLLVIALPQKQEESSKEPAIQEAVSEKGSFQEEKAARMEAELERILEQVQGVGKVEVMITLKSSGRKTVEKDTSVSEDTDGSENGGAGGSRREEESTVYQRDAEGNEIPFVVEETVPVVEGVLVAAQGGENLTVAEDILDAAQVLFGVEAHKIKVMKLN